MNIWDIIILQPMLNVLIVLSHYLFNSFGLTIIALTIIIRLILLPLTLKQLYSTKAMTTLQPQLMELQRKYAKDRQKLAQEQMRLYRESGMSPVGCAVPMLIQMPIWIALYQSIMLALAVHPEGLLDLSRYLYPWSMTYSLLPLENQFLGLDLASGNTVLAILVGATMWVQQKMVMPSYADPRQAAQNRMMLWMMPLMFAFFSLSFPSGLAIYWVVSNIISIAIQYYVTGWGGLVGTSGPPERDKKLKRRIVLEGAPQKAGTAKIPEKSGPVQKEVIDHGEPGDKRQDSGGSRPKGLGALWRWTRRD